MEMEAGLRTEDNKTFYPILGEIPQLLAPEGICIDRDTQHRISINRIQYKEPYEEMATYDEISSHYLKSDDIDSALGEGISNAFFENKFDRSTFPEPVGIWLDAKGCATAQEEAYRHLTPLSGMRVLQLGGHGSHLVKFLMAGAREAWLVSPMLGELIRARALCRKFGLEESLVTLQGIAEEIPIQNAFLDRIYSGGCLHHTQIEMAAPEIRRILKPGGKASFVDPVMTLPYRMFIRPFYSQGIGRVDNAKCTPINPNKVDRFLEQFNRSRCFRSRTFVHFPLILATRYLDLNLSIPTIRLFEKVDHQLGRLIPFVRKNFSPIATICVEK